MDDNLITMDSDDDDEIFDSDEDIFDETVDVMNARLSLTKSTRGFRVVSIEDCYLRIVL